jgi:transketolase
MDLDDLNTKWVGFGWHVQRVNGHDFPALDHAIARAHTVTERPSMIIMDTIKSKGFFPGEGISTNHSMSIDQDTAEQACARLDRVQEV